MKIFLGEGMPKGALQDSLVTTPWFALAVAIAPAGTTSFAT